MPYIPVVIARAVPNLTFTNRDVHADICIPAAEDIYYPLLRLFYEKTTDALK